jgi:hypothetical protein
MNIHFDPIEKRAIDRESGLVVEWVRDEPPMERRAHFTIICAGTSIPFAASFDHGDRKISDDRSLTPGERFMRTSALKEKNYYAQNIIGEFDRAVFVELWHRIVSYGLDGFHVSVSYKEWKKHDMSDVREWRVG